MKYTYWIISQIIVLAWVILVIMNIDNSTHITLINSYLANLFKISPVYITCNTAMLEIILFIAGELSMLMFFAPLITKSKEKQGPYERKLEKNSVSNDESNAKIKVLENKIEVLEKALSDALKRN